jgi:archaellum component FlaC
MGDKLISGGDTNFTSASLDELADVIVAGAETHSFFIKDGDNWVAKTPNEVALLIQEYIDLPSNLIGDNLSVEINEDVIQLKNFGKGYYKYIPAVKDEVTGEITTDASYEYVEDDFVEGLEPRVTLNDKGILELAWYEPSKEDIDNINTEIESIVDNLESVSNDLKEVSDNIESVANDLKEVSDDVSLLDESVNGENGLKSQIEELTNEIGAPADDAGNEATGLYAEIERIDEELVTKADADAVYTKEETNTAIETAIGAAIADADHLKREIVDVLPDVAKADANTIYMVPSGLLEDDNKYYEWILINNVFEQVGSWEVDLKDYAKAADLEDLAEVVKEKADKGTTLADYGITDAYTKAEVYTKGEADQAIADKISEVNGGESAGEVLAQLNAYKKTLNMEVWGNETASGDSRVDLLENKVSGLEGAEPNFISSVD